MVNRNAHLRCARKHLSLRSKHLRRVRQAFGCIARSTNPDQRSTALAEARRNRTNPSTLPRRNNGFEDRGSHQTPFASSEGSVWDNNTRLREVAEPGIAFMLRPPHRRSRAALQRIERKDSARTILVALAANVIIAIAKFVAGLISGSTALLAESAHSLADASNEVLLGISL